MIQFISRCRLNVMPVSGELAKGNKLVIELRRPRLFQSFSGLIGVLCFLSGCGSVLVVVIVVCYFFA